MNWDTLTSEQRLAIYGHHYKQGIIDPHFPLPVPCYMTGHDERKYAIVRWMDNMDNFWTDEHGRRGISR